MRINWTFLVIVVVALVIFCRAIADSEEGTENPILLKTNGTDDKAKVTADPAKVETGGLNETHSSEQLESQGKGDEQKKVHDSTPKDEPKKNKEQDTGSKKDPKEGELPPVREKCDSLSNRCMDAERTFIACLQVPGNESPDLSLLIQNKGKGTLVLNISAPGLVNLDKKKIEVQENKDAVVKVSKSDLVSENSILLEGGNGTCSLEFKDQYSAMKKVELNHSSKSARFSIFNITLSTGVLVFAVLLTVAASVFLCNKLKFRHFTRKAPTYQKLDVELPLSHGSKVPADENEGWDDGWGDSWDDEEAPKTPSLPVTPNLSSKVMASRKVSKDAWND